MFRLIRLFLIYSLNLTSLLLITEDKEQSIKVKDDEFGLFYFLSYFHFYLFCYFGLRVRIIV